MKELGGLRGVDNKARQHYNVLNVCTTQVPRKPYPDTSVARNNFFCDYHNSYMQCCLFSGVFRRKRFRSH